MTDLSPEEKQKVGEKLYSKFERWLEKQHHQDRKYLREVFGKRPDSPVGKPFLTKEKIDAFIAGKMTGMILAGATGKEISILLSDPEAMELTIADVIRSVKRPSKPSTAAPNNNLLTIPTLNERIEKRTEELKGLFGGKKHRKTRKGSRASRKSKKTRKH